MDSLAKHFCMILFIQSYRSKSSSIRLRYTHLSSHSSRVRWRLSSWSGQVTQAKPLPSTEAIHTSREASWPEPLKRSCLWRALLLDVASTSSNTTKDSHLPLWRVKLILKTKKIGASSELQPTSSQTTMCLTCSPTLLYKRVCSKEESELNPSSTSNLMRFRRALSVCKSDCSLISIISITFSMIFSKNDWTWLQSCKTKTSKRKVTWSSVSICLEGTRQGRQAKALWILLKLRGQNKAV